MEEGKAMLSFGFSKKKETKVLKKLDDEDEKDEKDYVVSFDPKDVRSSNDPDKPLVIPLIQKNNWRKPFIPPDQEDDEPVKKKGRHIEVHGKNEIESQAAKEILEEAARRKYGPGSDEEDDGSTVVPLLMQNQAPDGRETEEHLDVELRPDEASPADYEQIPIEQYGMAMLRGMGWKEGEGIGKGKKLIKPVEAVLRPKGMGLGADRSQARQKHFKAESGSAGEGDENLELKRNAACVIESGKHKDLYGLVQGLDEDNARAFVTLAIGGEKITVSQMALKVVSKKEYDKYGKYLNKRKVDKYKEEQEKRDNRSENSHSDRHKGRSSQDRDEKYRDSRENESSRHSSSRHRETREDRDSSNRNSDRKRKHEEEHKYKHTSKSHSSSNGTKSSKTWLHPHLRVRMIDPEYKKGKYYKSKFIIEDVVSATTCICRTEEGRILEDIEQSMLETVIPRSEPSHVMLVGGPHRRKVGELLKRDKSRCEALVQLLEDRETIKASYDDICEYTGDINLLQDY